jgi:hypothetical protein
MLERSMVVTSRNLARAGTAPRVAMEIMRHSDMRLTAKTYTDAGLLPIADAVLDLPSLVKPITCTQIGTQNLFRTGHDQSGPVTKAASFSTTDLIENQTVKTDKSAPDRLGHEKQKNGQNRIRTYSMNFPKSVFLPLRISFYSMNKPKVKIYLVI